MNTIQTKGLSAGSLFKFLFLGSLLPFLIFGIVCGILAFFGYNTVTLNNANVHGITGLITGGVIGIALPIIFSAIFWIILSFGFFLWKLFFGNMNFTFKE